MKKTRRDNLISSLLAILAGLLVGFLILLITNPGYALPEFGTILAGGFPDGRSGIAQMLYQATPIILTGLSVGFAWQTGLFNIGASGQFTLGAYTAVLIAVRCTGIPGTLRWILAILGALVAGAVWGAVPGLLKAYCSVNEVISSIMMNYIGLYLTNKLIVDTVYDVNRNQSLNIQAQARLPKIYAGGEAVFDAGFLIALLIAVLIYIILERTTFGFELKACGKNADAAKYAGMNEKRDIVLSMVIAGALSGIGGALCYLADFGKHLQVIESVAAEGFNGISVALLGQSNPLGIVLAGLFIAYITIGGYNLQLYSITPELVSIIISVIIYFGAFALLIREVLRRGREKKTHKESEGTPTDAETLSNDGPEDPDAAQEKGGTA